MKIIHTVQCAKRHTINQVPIATLKEKWFAGLSRGMTHDFRHALIWHMEQHGATIAEIVKATGISRDIINKLLGREGSSTAAENALLISAYFGKTLEEFIRCGEAARTKHLAELAEFLRPDEAKLVEAQVLGILQSRGALSSS